ncbi:solute:sodium symporter family transporter [Halanaerobaculum tunisiense]
MGFVIPGSFLGFTGLVAYLTWRMTRKEELDSEEGYYLGGRSLTGIMIAGSLMLTNLSTEQMVGLNGQGFNFSMVVMSWEVGSAVALIIMALVFLPRYLKGGIATIPEFLEDRYDDTTRKITALMFLTGYVVTYLPTVLYSGGLALNEIFGVPELLDLSPFKALWITVWGIGIIGSIYAVFGGLKAVAVSDTLNGVGLIIGGMLVPIFGFMALGDGSISAGVDQVLSHHTHKLNSIGGLDSPVPWTALFTGMLFNNLFYWGTNQSIIQRTLGAKSLKEGQKGVLFAGLLKCITPLFLIVPGIIAFHMYGDSLAKADMAYPTLVRDVLPTPITGFFAAVLFGAILSSFNSALNSAVTLFSLNIYKPIFAPDASDQEIVESGKKFGMILAVVSMIIAPFIYFAPSGLYGYLQSTFGFYNVPILAIIVVGMFSKKVPAFAAKTAMGIHVVIYSIYMFGGFDFNFLNVLGVLFPLEVIIMAIIGKHKPRDVDYVQEYTEDVDITPWKYAKPVALGLFLFMLSLYVIFSPLVLAN